MGKSIIDRHLTAKFFAQNAITPGIVEKPGEFRGTPNVKPRAILSQAAEG